MLLSDAHQLRYERYYATKLPRVRRHAWHGLVDALVADLGATSVLDYGCGQEGNLARYAAYPVANYDPGVPEWAIGTQPVDLVVCHHVLEHIEEACLEAVVLDLLGLVRQAVLLLISCEPSTKTLPDGTPWHTCVHLGDWWAIVLQQIVTLYGLPFHLWELPRHLYHETPTEFGCLLVRKDVS
jgi:hypothetical protein